MEFYPCDAAYAADAAACAALFAHNVVLLPAISNANLGQLTLDLVISTLLQDGKTFGVELRKVGHLLSEAAPPIAGSAAFAKQSPHDLCLNLEVYQSNEIKLTIIQQRAPVFPGRVHAFVKEFVEWAIKSKVSVLCAVGGYDDMLRHDHNMMSRPVRTICSFDPRKNSCLARFKNLTIGSDVGETNGASSLSNNQWASVRGAGLAPLLYAQCGEQNLPFVAWLMSCAEGNNVPDAIAMTTQLFHILQIEMKTATSMPDTMPPTLPLAIPPSWNQLFGRDPDVSLYL
ncbi:putative proteasome assembly chaperone 2 [Plasmopara halstedii]